MSRMHLELADEVRQALLHIVKAALEQSHYPLSPEVEALRAVAAKLERGGKSKPTAMSSAHE